MSRFPRPVFPYPEVLAEGKWTLITGKQPFVAPIERVMSTPTGDSAHHRFIRAHEILHVALTPDTKEQLATAYGVDLEKLEQVEEARINSVLERRLGITLPENEEELDPTFAGYKEGPRPGFGARALMDIPEAVCSMLALHGRKVEQERFLSRIGLPHPQRRSGDEVVQLYQAALTALWHGVPEGEIPGFERVLFIACALQGHKDPEEELKSLTAALEEEGGSDGPTQPSPSEDEPTDPAEPEKDSASPAPKEENEEAEDAEGEDAEDDDEADGEEDEAAPEPEDTAPKPKAEAAPVPTAPQQSLEKQILEAIKSLPRTRGGAKPPTPTTAPVGVIPVWGKLTIHHPRLRSPSVDTKHGRRRRRLSEEGVIPRALWREEIDGAIFEQRTKGRHLSLLIDCSGSMRLRWNDVQAFLNVVPAASIAIYAGGYGGAQGDLVVVAEKRRRLSNEDFRPQTRPVFRQGSNVVDLPALEWLARQRQPRIWLSDGGAFPSHYESIYGGRVRHDATDVSGRQLLTFLLAHHIYQFLKLSTALAALKANNLGQPRYTIHGLEPADIVRAGAEHY